MKLKQIQKGAGIALAALLVSVALSTTAKAVILAPGGSSGAVVGSFQAGSTLANVVSAGNPNGQVIGSFGGGDGTIQGTFRQSVYSNPVAFGPTTPSLDFYYRFTISAGAVGDASAVEFLNGLNLYQTDVFFLDTAALASAYTNSGLDPIFAPITNGVSPIGFSRSGDGQTVNFRYGPGNEVNVGETTFVLLIKTDASNASFTGRLNVLGGDVANGDVFEPIGPAIPEPTAALFGCALVGTVFFSRRRKTVVTA